MDSTNDVKTKLTNYHDDYGNADRLLILYEFPPIQTFKDIISWLEEKKGNIVVHLRSEELLPIRVMEEIAHIWRDLDSCQTGGELENTSVKFVSKLWRIDIDTDYQEVHDVDIDYFVRNYNITKENARKLYNFAYISFPYKLQQNMGLFWVVAKLRAILTRVRERLYQPGGRGFLLAKSRFERRT